MAPDAGRPFGGAVKKSLRSPDPTEVRWLARGLSQPGGKVPLFDEQGRRVSSRLVRACLKAGWIEPWFRNPTKPDWQVCRLTANGRAALASYAVVAVDFTDRRARRLT
jgi:hypothetical protein